MDLLRLLACISMLGVLGALAASASAAADQAPNWAGYVSSGPGTRFTNVSATWVQPAVSCAAGHATYMSNWIGLGGDTSQALEQIGTEADCGPDGQATYSSWFELYPTVSGSPKLTIRAGDLVSASVTVIAGHVSLSMTNQTRATSFARTLVGKRLDVSSAEWIVEAPSVCATPDLASCKDSVLSDFGSTGFTRARASTPAHSGTVTGTGWTGTPYTLTSGRPNAARAAGRVAGRVQSGSRAIPSGLTGHADAFGVSFAGGAQ